MMNSQLADRAHFNSYVLAHYGLSSLWGAKYFIDQFIPWDLDGIDWGLYTSYLTVEDGE